MIATVAAIVTSLCLALLLYTYLVFPIWMKRRAAKIDDLQCESNDQPFITVFMAVHNEERVLEAKIKALLEQDYPADRWKLVIYSDGSTDGTDSIGMQWADGKENVVFHASERKGKVGQINRFLASYKPEEEEVLVLTDANVMPEPDVLKKLANCFSDKRIGLVQPWIKHPVNRQGVAQSEAQYIEKEMQLKASTAKVYGVLMGAFGGFYALRASLVKPLPEGWIADDFYLTLKVLQQGYETHVVSKAIAYEDLPESRNEEYRRKYRIAAGNRQNLRHFASYLLGQKGPQRPVFISHKLLRWIGPWLLLGLFIFVPLLFWGTQAFWAVLFSWLLLWSILWIGPIGRFRPRALVALNYFLWMNRAMLLGWFQNLKGKQAHVWKPVKRNQIKHR